MIPADPEILLRNVMMADARRIASRRAGPARHTIKNAIRRLMADSRERTLSDVVNATGFRKSVVQNELRKLVRAGEIQRIGMVFAGVGIPFFRKAD